MLSGFALRHESMSLCSFPVAGTGRCNDRGSGGPVPTWGGGCTVTCAHVCRAGRASELRGRQSHLNLTHGDLDEVALELGGRGLAERSSEGRNV